MKMTCPTCRTNVMKIYKSRVKKEKQQIVENPRDVYAEDILYYYRDLQNVFDQLEDQVEPQLVSSNESGDLSLEGSDLEVERQRSVIQEESQIVSDIRVEGDRSEVLQRSRRASEEESKDQMHEGQSEGVEV